MALSSAPARSRPRFSIGILVPVVLSLAISAASALVFALWSAQGVDERALEKQVELARHVIETQLRTVPRDQESVAVWDDALARTKLEYDAQWVHHNLGRWMRDYFHQDDVILLDDAHQPLYAMTAGVQVGAHWAAAVLADIQPLLHQIRSQLEAGSSELPQLADVATINGVPTIVSITPIVSDTGEIPQEPGSEYLHVSLVRLDADYAERLSTEYQVPGLTFTLEHVPEADRAAIPLTNADGRFVTFMEWARSSPGQELLNQTLPAIGGAFLVAGAVALLLVHQLWRKSRALEAGRVDAEHRAAHDTLTGLPNRLSFETVLSRALATDPGHERRTSVLILDLDRFKQVNDTLGHRAGDDLLRAVAQRLGQLLGPNDFFARLGGDEFAIIHRHGPGEVEPVRLSHRIVDAVGKPFVVHGSEAFVGVSIGIASAEGDDDGHELMRKGDIALYEAKATGRNRAVVFEESMNELLQGRKTIEVELREALRRSDQLGVAFQPLFGRDGNMVGAEALSRWLHPRLGQISPAHFIPVAEATGLIEQLGTLVLRSACEFGARWPGYTIAVNISPAQLRNPDFPRQVFRLLADTGMRPADLELEITENILLEEGSDAAEALRLFRAAGIKIALDDFGTGYSSLNYLKRYPVDRIKIDRTFVSQLEPGSVSIAIVQAMVTLAHALRIDVTAEGVETEAQRSLLLGLGCNVFQGFLMSAPLSRRDLEAMIEGPQTAVA